MDNNKSKNQTHQSIQYWSYFINDFKSKGFPTGTEDSKNGYKMHNKILTKFNMLMNVYIQSEDDIAKFIKANQSTWFYKYVARMMYEKRGKMYTPEQLLKDYTQEVNSSFLALLASIRYVGGFYTIHSI